MSPFWTGVRSVKGKIKRSKKAHNRVSLQFWTGETPPPLYGQVQKLAEGKLYAELPELSCVTTRQDQNS